jgi:hypothetical protein
MSEERLKKNLLNSQDGNPIGGKDHTKKSQNDLHLGCTGKGSRIE